MPHATLPARARRYVVAPKTQESSAAPATQCPLSKSTFVDPVILPTGFTIDRGQLDGEVHRLAAKGADAQFVKDHTYRDLWTKSYVDANGDLDGLDEDPVTNDKLTDPFVASDGQTYNKSTILKLMSKNKGLSPFTRQPLNADAIRNLNARRALRLPASKDAKHTVDLDAVLRRARQKQQADADRRLEAQQREILAAHRRREMAAAAARRNDQIETDIAYQGIKWGGGLGVGAGVVAGLATAGAAGPLAGALVGLCAAGLLGIGLAALCSYGGVQAFRAGRAVARGASNGMRRLRQATPNPFRRMMRSGRVAAEGDAARRRPVPPAAP